MARSRFRTAKDRRARRNPGLTHSPSDWRVLEDLVRSYGSREVREAVSQIAAESG